MSDELKIEILKVINSIPNGREVTREQFLDMPYGGRRWLNKWKRDRDKKLSELDVIMMSFVHEGLLETGRRRGAYKYWVKRNTK
jgi:hypothetical protein